MLPKGREHFWVTPRLVCEVKHRQRTEEGLLRQPTFSRMRPDKASSDCVLPDTSVTGAETGAGAESRGRAPNTGSRKRGAAPAPVMAPAPARTVELVNPDKIFWPGEGYRKKDLFDYYRAISPWLLPYLKDRPLVLTRYPDGIDGKFFFQKDARGLAPPWIRTERMWSEDTQRDIDYFIADDVETLLFLANLGTIPLHVWASRVPDLGRPDWSIIDLDPKGAPFAWVVKLARAVHELCDDIGLPSYAKTSGQAGLHVLVPLGGQLTHEQSTQLAQLIARTIEARHGDISTTIRQVERRGGKVYLDYLQNGHGKTIAGPFSARPVAGATISMPLKWNELNSRLDPKKFTIASGPARMERLGADPLAGVLRDRPDLMTALARLAERLR